jgi:phage terminase large subunit GpA-like protein
VDRSEGVYRQGFFTGLLPDPDYTVSSWADEHRMLSQKASAEPGRWRTDRTPYLRSIMDDLSPMSPVKTVVFMAGAQVGKTECGSNWVGFVMHHAPGPMMMVQPTVDTAKRVSKQRLAPMIEETPVLRKIVTENKSRDASNTQMVKEFEGGVLILTGANSAVGLRSMPIRYLFLDELDGYPADVDGEGDPVTLAERRTTTFARRKIYKCSTPTEAATSRINRDFLASDQRKYFVACPHCDEMQWLQWGGQDKPFGIKWKQGEPEKAYYVCEHNGCIIQESSKAEMLLESGYGGKAEWRPTAPSTDATIHGYHLSSLYSPLGWKSWGEIASEFLRAKSDPMLLKTWVNTVLGDVWEDEYASKVGADGLMARMEPWQLMNCPMGVLTLTAGIDVQDNRLEIKVVGWGDGEEAWIVNWVAIHGDPQRPEIWAQLDDLLAIEYAHASGAKMKVRAAAIDTGGSHTQAVYDYSRRRKGFIVPVKGMSEPNKPILGKPTKQDVSHKGVVLKSGVELYPVGPDTAKSLIYSRLKMATVGAGYIHFPSGLAEDYFKQLTAETQVVEYLRGFAKRKWVKSSGQRNEALDCMVYAVAALEYIKTRYNRFTLWKQLAALLPQPEKPAEPIVEEVVVESTPENTPAVLPPKATTARPTYQLKRPGMSSWVKGYR